MGFFHMNHPFWGTPLYGNPQVGSHHQVRSASGSSCACSSHCNRSISSISSAFSWSMTDKRPHLWLPYGHDSQISSSMESPKYLAQSLWTKSNQWISIGPYPSFAWVHIQSSFHLRRLGAPTAASHPQGVDGCPHETSPWPRFSPEHMDQIWWTFHCCEPSPLSWQACPSPRKPKQTNLSKKQATIVPVEMLHEAASTLLKVSTPIISISSR